LVRRNTSFAVSSSGSFSFLSRTRSQLLQTLPFNSMRINLIVVQAARITQGFAQLKLFHAAVRIPEPRAPVRCLMQTGGT
jgi:hypothetical protein